MSLTGQAPVSSSFSKHDQTELYLQQRRIGHVALDAFLDVVLRLLELVGDVFEHGALVEVLDQEDRAEHSFQAFDESRSATHDWRCRSSS